MFNKIISEIEIERGIQDQKWGERNHLPEWWMQILMEEVGEASRALLDGSYNLENKTLKKRLPSFLEKYREELIQVAAVAIAAIESFDRNSI